MEELTAEKMLWTYRKGNYPFGPDNVFQYFQSVLPAKQGECAVLSDYG
jgi:hypothetical protein